MSSTVAVSVVIPCYNGAKVIGAAIRSVLDQAEVSSEVLVVDDLSTDDSLSVALNYAAKDERVKSLRRSVNGGPAAARNDGLRAAKGRYVTFLDADDEHAPGFLATAIQLLDADPILGMVSTGIELINCHRPIHPVQLEAIEGSAPSNLVVRRIAAELVGGFPEGPEFRGPTGGEDIAFRLAIKQGYRSVKVFKPLLRGHVRRGSHFDYFLDRTGVEDGRMVFSNQAPGELDRSIITAQQRYLDRARERFEAAKEVVEMKDQQAHAPATPSAGEIDESRKELDEVPGMLLLRGRNVPKLATTIDECIRNGTNLTEQGEYEGAIASFQQALSMQPDCFPAHFHLGNTLTLQGKAPLAIASFRTAVRLNPDNVEALTALGVGLAKQGLLHEAIATLEQAIRAGPKIAKTHLNLGVALAQSNKLNEAAVSLTRAIELKPDYTDAYFNLGNVLCDLNKRGEAVEQFERVLQIKPDHVEALHNLGAALTELGRMGTSVIVLKQAVRLKPGHIEAWNNLGLALAGQGRFEEAIDSYEKTLALNPRHVDAHNNMGSAYRDLGRVEEAVACYQQAIRLQPDNASSHWNHSLALLQKGDFERGLPEYEWRWRRKNTVLPHYHQARWDGSPLAGRTILLHVEQGLGDMIQFIRYAPLVRRAGGKVIVACPERMRRLFSIMEGIDRFVHEGEELPQFDVHAPLMSLPLLLGTTLETIPAQTPYLRPEPDLAKRWGQCFAGLKSYKIGIAWQGNPRHLQDRHRSIPLSAFAPLAAVPNVQLFSLQLGPGTEALKDLRAFPVTVLFDDLKAPNIDFVDTAAVMQHLDLVVCADTAVAHLAGALGVPVWMALATITDWRWLLHRTDTPWYPTMRLFRQTRLGDWDGLFVRLSESLAKHLRIETEGGWDSSYFATRIDG